MNEYEEFLLRILNVIDNCNYSQNEDERGHDKDEVEIVRNNVQCGIS